MKGDEFQRVSFSDDRHSGVLTQASILTLTSNPGRTSPVKRGKWILENILGTPPPDPPPDVPELEATQRAKPAASLRQQLEIHRSNAVCASCHKTMDELGFGLENFDAIGRWRDKDGKLAVDSSGKLPSGDKFRGPVELAQVLKRQKVEFGRCLAEKMLVFALGRGFESYDRCAIDTIVEELEKHRLPLLGTGECNRPQCAVSPRARRKTMTLPISRRTVLKGVGCTLGLPLLEAMLPARLRAAAEAKPPVRMAFVTVPNGPIMDAFRPTEAGDKFELPPTLQPLAEVRSEITVLTGLAQDNGRAKGDGAGDHAAFQRVAADRRSSGENFRGEYPRRAER